MSNDSDEQKPKVEGKKARRPTRAYKKEFVTTTVGLEEDTFDIGHPKYAAKYERSVDAISRHVQKEYKSGADVALAMRELIAPTVTMPTYPADPNNQEAIQIWKEELREKRTQSLQIDESKKRAYALVMGQCSPDLVSKIRGASTYANVNASQDVVELLRLIRGFCCDFGAGQQSTWALEQAKHKVSVYYQRHDTSNTDYIQFFQALVGVVETYGGAYGNEPGLIEAHLIGQGVAGGRLDAATSAQLAAAKADCREAYLACMLLRGADSIRYGTLKTELANDMTKGQDNYPKTMVEAARLLNDYRVATRFQRARDDPGEGMAFVQDRGGGRRTGGGARASANRDPDDPNCWHCGKPGHVMRRCPDLAIEGVDNFNIDETDDAHALFSAEDEEYGKETDPDAELQECGFAQKGRSKPTGVRGLLDPNHLYIDTCASYASTPYRSLLEDVHEVQRGLVGHSNCGSTTMNEVGNLGKIEGMWVNEGGIANIVPLEMISKIWRITYDSAGGMNAGHFVIHTDQGNIVVRKNSKGMPFIDLDGVDGEMALDFVQTIRGNYDGFTRREVEEARAAREAQGMMGHPTDRDFLGMVRANMIHNCPVTASAAENANRIFGPDLAGVRGRTVRRPPEAVRTDYVQLPRVIMERYRVVVLTADVMFVNKVPFLVSQSRGLNLITCEFLPGKRTAKSLAARIDDIKHLYARGGFVVGTILMDNEFEKVRPLVPGLNLNTTAAKEHVPEIERRIRLIKERGRALLNTLPYKKMPQLILIELIYHVVLWLNAFPSTSGVSETLSPREIVLRHRLDFAKHCRAPFGSYCEAHDEPAPTNNMISRATPSIVLGPTGNLQGTYKFFSLTTGKKIKRRQFTRYPMPDSVIAKVEQFARAGVVPGALDFADRSGILFEWNEDIDASPGDLVEEDYVPYPAVTAEFPGVDLARDAIGPTVEDDVEPHGRPEDAAALNADILPVDIAGVGRAAIIDAHADEIAQGYDNDDDDGIIAVGDLPPPHRAAYNDAIRFDTDEHESDTDGSNDNASTVASDEESDDDEGDSDDDDDNDDDDDHGDDINANEAEAMGLRRSRRANKGRTQRYANYTLLLNARRAARGGPKRATIKDGIMMFSSDDISDAKPVRVEDRLEYAFGVILQQYSIGAGLRKFQERGEKGVTKELSQMHNMAVFAPIMKTDLTPEEKKKAISSLMFLKEKRDATIKARFCADGRKQRGDWTKQETTSPTVSNESVFLTSVIDAHERRDVGCYDIPGAFLHADSDEDITMVLKGRLAELMVQVAPNLYRKYVTVDKRNVPILYVKIQKALYGLLRSALLFYKKLVGDLEGNGFVLNPYDPCVANKMINGAQMTVCWHVDDLKVSHVDPQEVTKFGAWLSNTYGIAVAEHRGKVHDYLGMILDFTMEGHVIINMTEYIKTILSDFPEDISGTRTTPAGDHLFQVRDPSEARLLPEEQATSFHHAVAQLLFLSARARRDIQPVTAFLTTRVKSPDEDDWGKLKRLLQYLKGTLHMPLILSADSMTMPRWWVDAAFAVHDDCKSHTGAGMSLGRGMAMSYSWKQKINTKSSTEAELVGVDDSLAYILWARYFLQEQGYDMEPSLLYQDNMSAILLETNGKASSSKRTKHIKVKYFYIKDKIDQDEIVVEHCPTDQMWTDINTKPKQGAVFREFRGQVMGILGDYVDSVFEHSIYLRPPDSPVGYEPRDPTSEPTMSQGKTILPVPKDGGASQECVDDHRVGEPADGGGTEVAAEPDVARHSDGVERERAPLLLVQGKHWSPGVYRSMRLLGRPLMVAWERAFIALPTF